MKITFCGAARNVTGSCHLVTLDTGFTILLDCGLFQGNRKTDPESNETWLFDPADINCVILSHAHIDHTGRLPKLVKDGFEGCIHATHATRSLCSIMLLDSAKIQERDADFYNKKVLKKRKKKKNKKNKIPLRTPLYDSEDVHRTMELFNGYSYNRWHKFHDQVEVLFKDQGHILGSSSVTLRIHENGEIKTLGFTGDIGRPDRPILRDPQMMPEVDNLICESTYGDREHESSPEQTDTFLEIMRRTCLEKKGKLIIPAFSIGRTQEIVYLMDQLAGAGKLPRVPVYVDSPLAVNATEIYGAHSECFDNHLHEYMLTDDDPFGFNSLHYVRTVDLSKELNFSEEPMVIISASGMMNAGRIRHHLYHNLEDPRCTFLIVGYCAPDTAGGILKAGAQELKVLGDVLEVRAEIKTMDSFSAHGDRKEMLQMIQHQRSHVKNVFLVHGEYRTQQAFKSYLEDHGFEGIHIPALGESVSL